MLGKPALANLRAPRPTPNLSSPCYLILDPDSNPTMSLLFLSVLLLLLSWSLLVLPLLQPRLKTDCVYLPIVVQPSTLFRLTHFHSSSKYSSIY